MIVPTRRVLIVLLLWIIRVIRIGVLRRIGRHRSENVTIGRDFLLRRCRWRGRRVTSAAPVPASAVNASASDVSHELEFDE